MRMRNTVLSIVLAVAVATPSALATWRALGSYEPDTVYDKTEGWMFADPPQTFGVNAVYFNVVSTQYLTATNPNMAVANSRVLSLGTFTLEAFYGVWLDCNLDGYIGMADSALFEYRSELLPANHICGDATRSNDHNQQGWVSEMRWIGPPGGADGNDPDDLPDGRDNRLIKDSYVGMWGDNGLPGDALGVAGPGCDLYYHRTGQVMNYLDCVATANADAGTEPVGAALGFAPGDDGEIDYDQPNALNMVTFGEEDADPAFNAWDCSAGEQGIVVGDADQEIGQNDLAGGYKSPGIQYTDSEGELNLSVYGTANANGTDDRNDLVTFDPTYYSPAPTVNPSGSIAAGWNRTTDGATGDCNPENGAGTLYGSETQPDVREPGKAAVTYEFRFIEEQRSGVGKDGEPFDRGVYPGVRAGAAVIFSGSRWFGGNFAGNDGQFVRTDLTTEGARYFTFYANITDSVRSQYGLVFASGGVTGTYGDEWCDGATDGVIGGFNCNPDEWYIDAEGNRLDGREFAIFAGHQYIVKDTDCYDYRIGDGPVYASAAVADPNLRCAE